MVSFEKSWTWLALAQTLGSVNEIYPKLKIKIKIKIKGQKGEQACEGGTVSCIDTKNWCNEPEITTQFSDFKHSKIALEIKMRFQTLGKALMSMDM